ncbi:MAG: GNAT family acetyltransferase [Alphaproteobacteria bacterium]|nr:GNAT family acetyltransferase [Alphaproteobacteria bacterium]MDP6815730.1 GNAT family acetyltransferase [Alphaproteobacteria bacterium]
MKIRNFLPDDRAAVIDLWRRCGLLSNPLNDPGRDIDFCLGEGNGEILVLEEDGAVLATAMLGQDGHRGWVYYLATEPDRRHEGLGRRLMQAAEHRLRQQGVPKMQLMVRDSNSQAIGYYQRLGYIREPATLMSRRLDGIARPLGHQMDDEPVIITYLEMTERPPLPRIEPGVKRHALMRAHDITTEFYRYLYDAVGRPWYWTDRKKLSDEQLAEILGDPAVEVYVLYANGAPAGFFELDGRGMPRLELAYFGILPDYIGKGLGRYLLEAAIETAWNQEPKRLTVNTCTLDHPSALPMYQRFGFKPYDREEVPAPWQTEDNVLDFA